MISPRSADPFGTDHLQVQTALQQLKAPPVAEAPVGAGPGEAAAMTQKTKRLGKLFFLIVIYGDL